jgi:hypothetical protein
MGEMAYSHGKQKSLRSRNISSPYDNVTNISIYQVKISGIKKCSIESIKYSKIT